jgi:GntR family transcriptional regulator, rspAB operon transcriptional repressor
MACDRSMRAPGRPKGECRGAQRESGRMSARAARAEVAPRVAEAVVAGRPFESARVHAWLRRAILDVSLRPGSALAEAEVAAQFGLSRTPVREALLKLAGEGLIEIRPQRGTYVARIALPRIEEALFVREAVECAVLRRVLRRDDRAQVARALATIVDAQEAALAGNDVAAGLAADERFHHALVDACGLPGVWEVVARARDLHHRIRAIAVPELRSGRQAVADHRAIVRAVRAGSAARAEARMAAHLARNLALARAIAARHPDYFVP